MWCPSKDKHFADNPCAMYFCDAFNSSEMKARLKRMASPSLFGADIIELSFHAEMQTNNRLRFKVQPDPHV